MGSISRITIESRALKNNMLGDSSLRVVDVYVPAGHDGQGLPLLVDLVGFTSSGLSAALNDPNAGNPTAVEVAQPIEGYPEISAPTLNAGATSLPLSCM